MTKQEEVEQQAAAFYAKLAADFDYMDDATAETIINSLKSVDQQIADATYKASVEQKSIEYAAKQVKEELRQKAIKSEQLKWERTADQREQERLDALEKMRRVGEYGGPSYDSEGNSNQRIPDASEYRNGDQKTDDYLNASERRR